MLMEIMFINQQTLFTTIDKDISFCGLITPAKRKKEEPYRDSDLLMRHLKKSVFAYKRIVCDVKLKSIMDEVSNGMRIEMNDTNPENHVHEVERNNGVIK